MALTKLQLQLLSDLKQVAQSLGEEGRCLTDLIGELSACRYLNLKWKPSDGYDAVSKNGELVQIKTRKSWNWYVKFIIVYCLERADRIS